MLYASKKLLSAHTVAGGQRTFTLPETVEVVFDLFRNEIVTQDVDKFQVTLPPASANFYYTGDAELLDKLQKD